MSNIEKTTIRAKAYTSYQQYHLQIIITMFHSKISLEEISRISSFVRLVFVVPKEKSK